MSTLAYFLLGVIIGLFAYQILVKSKPTDDNSGTEGGGGGSSTSPGPFVSGGGRVDMK